MNELKHLAIIMDGNGRWAERRGRERFWGHVRGAKVAQNMIEKCVNRGIQVLTLYAFSTENWLRPHEEVKFLMQLLRRQLIRERIKLQKQNIRFSVIGDLASLPEPARREVYKTVELTAGNTGMQLVFALSYGARQELTQAVQRLAQQVCDGSLQVSDIDQNLISQSLQTAHLPDPDLIVRTSGESRLSNFLLWQAAYSELYICDTLWPDFNEADLDAAIAHFNSRERRFGKTGRQTAVTNSALTFGPHS